MKKAVVVIALALVLLSLIAGMKPASAQNAKWTFMIYLDADNNLEDIGIDNFLLMAQVGSTNDLKIVIQFDRSTQYDNRYGDWSSTKRYLVEKDMLPDSGSALQDLGELNMADPTTLSDFVKWAATAYPADRYFLDVWDHGLGWQGVAVDDYPSPNDRMTAIELGEALSDIRAYLGRPLDILANDACRMTLEIMYQAAPHVSYMVGSEKDEPAEGWPYDTVLGTLAANPSMNPIQLGTVLVDRYIDSYSYPNGSSYSVAMALVDSSALTSVVQGLNSFVSAMNYSLPYFVDAIVDARNRSEHYEGNQCVLPTVGDDYDLSDVAKKVQANVENERVFSAANELILAVDAAVIHENHMDLAGAVNCVRARNATGLSLWYPWTIGSKLKDYGELALSQDSLWDEHLKTYHNSTRPHIGFDVSLVLEDRDSDSRMDNARFEFHASESGSVVVDVNLEGIALTSHELQVSANIHGFSNISLPRPGIYDFDIYLRQTIGTVNATSFRNVHVTATLTFRGFVRDSYGNPLDNALVRVSNLKTGQSVTTATSNGYYSVDVLYPAWIASQDNVSVEAEKDGRRSSLIFNLQYRGQRFVTTDLYLQPASDIQPNNQTLFGQHWPMAAVLLACVIAEAAILILIMTGSRLKRRRFPPS